MYGGRAAVWAILLALVLAILCSPAQARAYDLQRQVVEFQLSNGMRWLVVRRPEAPVFSGVVMIRVGGADELPGKTGLAHMFEHMAFKGSSRVGTRDWKGEKPLLQGIEEIGDALTKEEEQPHPDPTRIRELSSRLADLERQADALRIKNEIWEVLARNGGTDLNAYTSKDLTAYHASMPADRLELWAHTTAEMVFHPAFREFYTERRVIEEERRAGTENNPDGVMSERLLSTSFEEGPYSWSTIGFEKDISHLTIADARAFHRAHYVPSNMVGVLVGDVNVARARSILEQSFGNAARRGKVPQGPAGPGKARIGVVERFGFDAEPSLAIAWHKPTLPDPAEYVFDVIEALLCEGRSSRLQRRLIYEQRLAESISCTVGFPGSRFDNLFLVWIDPLHRKRPEDLIAEVDGEIRRLAEEPVETEELEGVKKRVRAGLIFSLEQDMALAQQLAEFEIIFGDWRLLARYPERIDAVTPADVLRIAKRYLQSDTRVVVERFKR